MFCKSSSTDICFCCAHCSCIECDRNMDGELMQRLRKRKDDYYYSVSNFTDSCKRLNYEFPSKVEDIKENDLFYTSAGELVKATKIGRKYIHGIRLYQRDEIKCRKDSIDLGRVRRMYV